MIALVALVTAITATVIPFGRLGRAGRGREAASQGRRREADRQKLLHDILHRLRAIPEAGGPSMEVRLGGPA